jgi:hypothetical protein
MARSDKKNRTCKSCGKKFASPQKLRQHYNSKKNQCSHQTDKIQKSAPKVDQDLEEYEIIDTLARKPNEHPRTWGAGLRKRWIELTGERCDLPITLKACEVLYNDLIQIDEDAIIKVRKKSLPDSLLDEQEVGQEELDEQKVDQEELDEQEVDEQDNRLRFNFEKRGCDSMRLHSLLNQLSV